MQLSIYINGKVVKIEYMIMVPTLDESSLAL